MQERSRCSTRLHAWRRVLKVQDIYIQVQVPTPVCSMPGTAAMVARVAAATPARKRPRRGVEVRGNLGRGEQERNCYLFVYPLSGANLIVLYCC